MKDSWRQIMSNVTRLTQTGRLRDATAAIQRALGGPRTAPASDAHHPQTPGAPFRAAEPPAAASPDHDALVIDVSARVIVDDAPVTTTRTKSFTTPEVEPAIAPAPEPAEPPASKPRVNRPNTGCFIDGRFGNAAGSRPYKLFVPGGMHAQVPGLPLVVMLHGCKQNPEDFAAGTLMNELAQAQGWVVLYPGQERASNPMGCWNWFQEGDQQRDGGEPAILAGMTGQIIDTYDIDPRRVYVAGLSAGGAMAAILATIHPELFAAAGIHSGLPHAAANDVASALRAMKHGPRAGVSGAPARTRRSAPTIVFHGDRDKTVHPDNGHEVIAQARNGTSTAVPGSDPDSVRGEVPGGHRFTRTVHRDSRGRCDAEHWVVHGSGHAWSGGSPKGSYTDPLGPDASREMLRFFAEHPLTDDDTAA